MKKPNLPICLLLLAGLLGMRPVPAGAASEGTTNGGASIVISANVPSTQTPVPEPALIYRVQDAATWHVTHVRSLQSHQLEVTILQGTMKELEFRLHGDAEIQTVKSTAVQEWSIRRRSDGSRSLVLIPVAASATNGTWKAVVTASPIELTTPATVAPTRLTPQGAALATATLEVTRSDSVEVEEAKVQHLARMDRPATPSRNFGGYTILASDWVLELKLTDADPSARNVDFSNYKLEGEVSTGRAAFVLEGTASVRHPEGGFLPVLSGGLALTGYKLDPATHLTLTNGQYYLHLSTNGAHKVRLEFEARVQQEDDWQSLDFSTASATLRPVVVRGLTLQDAVQFDAGVRAYREKNHVRGALPSTGPMKFRWKPVKAKEESKLFYAVDGFSQLVVSPGLLRQWTQLKYQVMQGQMTELVLALEGRGEVTRVESSRLLNWSVNSAEDGTRQLKVRLTSPQTGTDALVVHTQTPLGGFPVTIEPTRVIPTGAIRFGGYIRAIPYGAVRLDPVQTQGLAQISPGLVPAPKEAGALTPAQTTQAFAFRFSGPEHQLTLRAEDVLPETSVSEVLRYHLGETESQIHAELELDIREAPLREYSIEVPTGYGVSEVRAAHLADYNLTPAEDNGLPVLRLRFARPLLGRQVLAVTLSRNHDAPPADWPLPPFRPLGAKSIRGFVGVSADPGLRLTASDSNLLTELAPAFFPKKIADLQLAWRLREGDWSASVLSERLELSIQSDSLHLFSLAEGIAYGSTLINYLISGAPVTVLKVAAPAHYANVEFVGQEIRHWAAVEGGYEVHLHTPISGTYSLLATYDIRFKDGDLLAFNGLAPLETQSEKGYVVIVSGQQFQTTQAKATPGLIPLETGEIPVEYRLLFDTPILAAYQFTSRPFNLELQLDSLRQGEIIQQVIDRAVFNTRLSGEGNVVTDIRYLVKSRGHSHLSIRIPKGSTLWSARVDGREVVPVTDQEATLIPLPNQSSGKALLNVELNVAFSSGTGDTVAITLPAVEAPLLLAGWNITPDADHSLVFRAGSVAPDDGPADISGFAWIENYGRQGRFQQMAVTCLFSLILGILLSVWSSRSGRHRGELRQMSGWILSSCFFLVALFALFIMGQYAASHSLSAPRDLSFSVPVQTAGAALAVQVQNVSDKAIWPNVTPGWPLLLGLAIWVFHFLRGEGTSGTLARSLGWMGVLWGLLALPNRAPWFFAAIALMVLVHVILPLWRRHRQLPPPPPPSKEAKEQPEPGPTQGTPLAASAGAWLLLLGLAGSGLMGSTAQAASAKQAPPPPSFTSIQSIEQTGLVMGMRMHLQGSMIWKAEAGEVLEFLHRPAVLISVDLPEKGVVLHQGGNPSGSAYRLVAREAGIHKIQFQYETEITRGNGTFVLELPTHYALVNHLQLDFNMSDVEVIAPAAASIVQVPNQPDTYKLTLSGTDKASIAWKPRGRDTSREKSVFYAEVDQLFVPIAGLVEGVHQIRIRPAQGEVRSLECQTPQGMTITDVTASILNGWRFDPDARRLQVDFKAGQATPFEITVRSQYTTRPLPFDVDLGLPKVTGAENQIERVGIATGPEVQLASIQFTNMTSINLEDFPPALVQEEGKRLPGLTLRRALRGGEKGESLKLSVAEVEPDIRVVSSQTLSLGEDRAVLAVELNTIITRAGIFRLQLELPNGLEVESISGQALSHWTESDENGIRILTLHLNSRTEGQQVFNLTLAGSGPPAGAGWQTPRLRVRQITQHSGQLLIVPEQGMRLTVNQRDGVTQQDPKAVGIRQRGALVFRLLRDDWNLTFDIEKVAPWIQVTTLQDILIREGQIQSSVNFQYTVENAGIKSLWVRVPADAEAVRFSGDQVADALRQMTNGVPTGTWEVKLQRRIIGSIQLRLDFQKALTDSTGTVMVHDVVPEQVDLRRGFLALRGEGRVQIQTPQVSEAWQSTDWNSIPPALRNGVTAEPNHLFRLVESGSSLAVEMVRHSAARLLPARVRATEISSVLSESGALLNTVRITIEPGDKRRLRIQLPRNAKFWFAFVNQAGVHPWMEKDQILIPLDRHQKPGEPSRIEFLYSMPIPGHPGNLSLQGPQFDLPLENVEWHIHLPAGWHLDDWDTTLQFPRSTPEWIPVRFNMDEFVLQESSEMREQTREAENLLQLGNQLLNQGDQGGARQAFQSAYSLSQHDNAFNEDARVQLQKLRKEQALVGLNYRRNAVLTEQSEASQVANQAALDILQSGSQPVYTPQQVKQALDGNSAEDNAALDRLAEHLVQQQEAAAVPADLIRATPPEQGQRFTFTRSLQVEPWTDLSVKLKTSSAGGPSSKFRLLMVLALFLTSLLAVRIGSLNRSKTAQ